jgi:hypothetical protein
MSSDSGEQIRGRRSVRFRLPNIVEVEIRPSTYDAPRHRNFKSDLVRQSGAVDFVVRTDRSIPSRALGPALFVGSTPVTEMSEIEPNVYRFSSLGNLDLEEDAEIRLGWTGQPPAGLSPSKFRFRRPTTGLEFAGSGGR